MGTKVSFAKNIKPLFTAIDVNHMKALGVKLNNYSYMSNPAGSHSNAKNVEGMLKSGAMPPGAPWPPAKVALFTKWMKDGYHK